MKIYIVQALGGRWEDSWESNIIAVKTEERAKELVEEYQRESDKFWYKAKRIVNEFENKSTTNMFRCGDIENAMRECFDTSYKYEEIEMEG